ncbi:MAG TPA: hypothetical protein VG408_04620 [Actinomycetota bacterium]|nr:hypothetical protein [Actinomycetota bacterium]
MGDRKIIPIPEGALQEIMDAYNALVDAIEAAGLPGPPKWG